VSDGYAKNFLIPKNLAKLADASGLNDLKNKNSAEEHRLAVQKAEAQANKEKIDGKTVKIKAKAGAGGRLFGSVTSKEIAEEIGKQYGVSVDKKKISLDADIKSFGTFAVSVKFMSEIIAKTNVMVVEE
jgi:large subunit ribosomal protein L9